MSMKSTARRGSSKKIRVTEYDMVILALQTVEGFVKGLIIPFVCDQLIFVVDDGESIDQMGAQKWIHVLGHVFARPGPVLGPVGKVTHHLGGTCWVERNKIIGGNIKEVFFFFVTSPLPSWHINRHSPEKANQSINPFGRVSTHVLLVMYESISAVFCVECLPVRMVNFVILTPKLRISW